MLNRPMSLKDKSTSDSLQVEAVIKAAGLLKFKCICDEKGVWQIRGNALRWYLEAQEDRWVLYINGQAQIRMYAKETIRFLLRRHGPGGAAKDIQV
jgi:hypothetical protein